MIQKNVLKRLRDFKRQRLILLNKLVLLKWKKNHRTFDLRSQIDTNYSVISISRTEIRLLNLDLSLFLIFLSIFASFRKIRDLSDCLLGVVFIHRYHTHSSEDWHSQECKLTPTLTFDLLTSNKIGDQDLSCTAHLPSLVMICPLVFVLECWHTHIHTYVQSG